MDAPFVSKAAALAVLSDDLVRPVALRPTARARLTGPLAQCLALLALLLAADALAVLLPAGRSAPPPAADLTSLPTPAGFSPVPVDANWAPLGVDLTDPARRGWTTAEDPDKALDAMVGALKGAGWTPEDVPAGGWLPPMPHLARLHRPGAQLFVNAWHELADSFTRVAVVLEP